MNLQFTSHVLVVEKSQYGDARNAGYLGIHINALNAILRDPNLLDVNYQKRKRYIAIY